ncbi:right-handed parallel beta-helix repeat-containing protein [Collimonas humicola]|uniref:right-handed parallel beta-helix repeat-containing protein n=1 Tax=Collimonas humicola TaxID=2825886 RepID=UPI001B8CBB94|nr:right-handed parallel beta-helix repeat-containing protein [Collimonas humicola]
MHSLQKFAGAALLAWLPLSGASAAAQRIIPIDPARADKPGFMVIIDEPGHYQLAGNMKVADPNTTAIEINADNVTIDLHGYAIQGPTRCQQLPAPCWPLGGGNGIHAVNRSHVAVRNGIVQGMGNYGIYLETNSASLDHVVVSRNGRGGAVMFGGAISNSAAENNGGDGIFGIDLKVSRNAMRGNQHFGLAAYAQSSFSNNRLSANNGNAVQTNLKSAANAGNTCNASACP